MEHLLHSYFTIGNNTRKASVRTYKKRDMSFKDSDGRNIQEYDVFRFGPSSYSIYFINKGEPTLFTPNRGRQHNLQQKHFEQETFVGNLKDNLNLLKKELNWLDLPSRPRKDD